MNYSLKVDRIHYLIFRSLQQSVSAHISQSDECHRFILESNTDELFAAALNLGLVHSINIAYGKIPTLSRHTSLFRQYSQVAKEVYKIQKDCWRQINNSLRSANIDSLVLKGLFFLSDVYKSQEYYLMNDVDLVVRPRCLSEVRQVVSDCGYSQRIISHDGVIRAIDQKSIQEFEEKHYELFPYTRVVEVPGLNAHIDFIKFHLKGHPFVIENEEIYLAIEFDIHHNLSHGFDLEDIWASPQRFQIDNEEAFAPSNEVLGWFVPARFYHEVMVLAKRKAKLLSDLVALVSTKSIDYQKVLEAADKYTLQPSLYYVYKFIKDFIGIKIPQNFLESLDIESNSNKVFRDWGDFLPKLLQKRVCFSIGLE